MVNTRCLFAATVAVVASFATFVAAPANAAEDKWVAIAVGTNSVVGLAEDVAGTQNQANDQARADCTQRGGTDCSVLASAANGCAAVAVGAFQVSGATGQTRAIAEDKAREYSKGGAVKLSACSTGTGLYGGGSHSIPLSQGPAAPAPQSNSREVTGDVDVYDVPGGVGSVIGMLEGGDGQRVQLGSGCKDDNWCNIVWPGGSGGTAWVWGDFLK